MKNKNELGIYIHIPFCVHKCIYCDFLSSPADEKTRKRYVKALIREINLAAEGKTNSCINKCNNESNNHGKDIVTSIFIGGGTPSVIDASDIKDIIEAVRHNYNVSDEAEITIECNPGTMDEKKAAIYRQAGINRISFGLQSTNNNELRMLGRIHTYEQFLESLRIAEETGFDNINIDLMSDIPKQSFESYKKTLERVVSLSPEHISSYSLIIEPGTVFYKMYEEGKLDIADEDTDRQMYSYTKDYLEKNGYHRYEISNYSKSGRECKHNLVYWNLEDYIGIGLGASSYFEGARFSDFSDMKKYRDTMYSCGSSYVSGGENAKKHVKDLTDSYDIGFKIRKRTENYEKLTEKAKMEEFMFVGLRKCIGVSKKEFENRFSHSIDEIYGNVIDKFIKNNLLSENDNSDRIYLTDKGIDVSNYILSEFLL